MNSVIDTFQKNNEVIQLVLDYLLVPELNTLKLVNRKWRCEIVANALKHRSEQKQEQLKKMKKQYSQTKLFYLQVISEKVLKLNDQISDLNSESMISFLSLHKIYQISQHEQQQKIDYKYIKSKSEQQIDEEPENLSKLKFQVDKLSNNNISNNINSLKLDINNLQKLQKQYLDPESFFLLNAEPIEQRFTLALYYLLLYSISTEDLSQTYSLLQIKYKNSKEQLQSCQELDMIIQFTSMLFENIENLLIVDLPNEICELIQSKFLWKFPLVDLSVENEEIMLQRKNIPCYDCIHLYLTIVILCNRQNINIEDIQQYTYIQDLENQVKVLSQHSQKSFEPLKYLPQQSNIVAKNIKKNALSLIFQMFDINDILQFRLVNQTWKFSVDQFLHSKIERSQQETKLYYQQLQNMGNIEKAFIYRKNIMQMSQPILDQIIETYDSCQIYHRLIQVHHLVSKNIEQNEHIRLSSENYKQQVLLKQEINQKIDYDFTKIQHGNLVSYMKDTYKFMRFAFDVYGYKLDNSLVDPQLWKEVQVNFLYRKDLDFKKLKKSNQYSCMYYWLLFLDLMMKKQVSINSMLDYQEIKQKIKKTQQNIIRPQKILNSFEKSQQERVKELKFKEMNISSQSEKQEKLQQKSQQEQQNSQLNDTDSDNYQQIYIKNSSDYLCETDTQPSEEQMSE